MSRFELSSSWSSFIPQPVEAPAESLQNLASLNRLSDTNNLPTQSYFSIEAQDKNDDNASTNDKEPTLRSAEHLTGEGLWSADTYKNQKKNTVKTYKNIQELVAARSSLNVCTPTNPNGVKQSMSEIYGTGAEGALDKNPAPSRTRDRRDVRSGLSQKSVERNYELNASEAVKELSMDEGVTRFLVVSLGHLVDQNYIQKEINAVKRNPKFQSLSPEEQTQVMLKLQIESYIKYLFKHHSDKLLQKLKEYDETNGTDYFAKFSPRISFLKSLRQQLKLIRKIDELDAQYGLDVEWAMGDLGFNNTEGETFQKREKDFLWVVNKDEIYADHASVTFQVKGMDFGLKTNTPITMESQGINKKRVLLKEKLTLIDEALSQISKNRSDPSKMEQNMLDKLQRNLGNEKERYEDMLADINQQDEKYDTSIAEKKNNLDTEESKAKQTLSFMKNMYFGALWDQSMIESFVRMTNERSTGETKIELSDGLDLREKQVLFDTYKQILIERGTGLSLEGKKLTGEQIGHIFDAFQNNLFKKEQDAMPAEQVIDGFTVNKLFFERILAREGGDGVPRPMNLKNMEDSFQRMNQSSAAKEADDKFGNVFP